MNVNAYSCDYFFVVKKWTTFQNTMNTTSGQKISGKEFNKLNLNTPLYKFTNFNSIHRKIIYKEGENIDDIPLTTNFCSAGGLYFTTDEKFYHWISKDSIWVWDVNVPDKATVVIEPHGKAKASKLVLSNKRLISEMKELKPLKIIQYNGHNFHFVKNPSTKLQLEAHHEIFIHSVR